MSRTSSCTIRRAVLLAAMVVAAAAAAGQAATKRIVTLIPSHTEIVNDLGARSSLVGVSSAEEPGDYPSLPRVGGVQPDWESLIALKPDIVLADTSHSRHRDTFARLGLPVEFLPGTTAKDFEEVFAIVRRVAELVDKAPEAEKQIAVFRDRFAKARSRIPPGERRPRVYFEIWPKPIQGAAPISLRGHLLEMAGAENILPDTKNLTAMVSLEWVPKQGPEVILHTGVISGREIAARPGWGSVPAVENGRIYAVDRNRFSRASLRIVEAYETLLDILYGKAPR